MEQVILMLTKDELKNIIQKEIKQAQESTPQKDEWLFGMKEIANFFGVSIPTAQNYKQTWLKPAISQRGRKIWLNTRIAKELAGNMPINQ